LVDGEWEHNDDDECEDYSPDFSYRLIKKKWFCLFI
jgi:hypothetical protein